MKTAVHCPTQEDYDRLMEAYEKKGWRCWLGRKPSYTNMWYRHEKETCIRFEDKFHYGTMSYYFEDGREIITVDEAIDRLKGGYDKYAELTDLIKSRVQWIPRCVGEVDGDYLVTSSGKRAEIKPINSLSNPTTMDKIKSAIRGVSKKVQLRRKHKIETVEGDLTSYGQEVILNLLWKGVKPEELKNEVDKILKNLED